MNNMEKEFITYDAKQTIDLGKQIAKYVFPNLVIALTGDLGAGKTTLVQGIALGLGINEKVTSPTFNILKCYFHNPISLYHIDAYRLLDTNKDIGLEEFIDGDGVCVIEWPQYIQEYLPFQFLKVELHHLQDNARKIIIQTDINQLKALFDEIEVNKNV